MQNEVTCAAPYSVRHPMCGTRENRIQFSSYSFHAACCMATASTERRTEKKVELEQKKKKRIFELHDG